MGIVNELKRANDVEAIRDILVQAQKENGELIGIVLKIALGRAKELGKVELKEEIKLL